MSIAFRTPVLFIWKNWKSLSCYSVFYRFYLEIPKKYYNSLNFCLEMLKKANLTRIICRGKSRADCRCRIRSITYCGRDKKWERYTARYANLVRHRNIKDTILWRKPYAWQWNFRKDQWRSQKIFIQSLQELTKSQLEGIRNNNTFIGIIPSLTCMLGKSSGKIGRDCRISSGIQTYQQWICRYDRLLSGRWKRKQGSRRGMPEWLCWKNNGEPILTGLNFFYG